MQKFHLIPAMEISYFSEKNNLNTLSISKFISVISFSIEITIKE